MTSIEHPIFGRFKKTSQFGSVVWEANIELPAFSAFRFYGNGKLRKSKNAAVRIYCDEEPSHKCFDVLRKIRDSQKQLVERICKAVFADLHQLDLRSTPRRTRDSGMWWYHDPVEVALSCVDSLRKRKGQDRILAPMDLTVLLYEPSIAMHPNSKQKGKLPRTLIEMGAQFEDEHGLSVLTDGSRVLGLGYAGEAEPFRTVGADG